MSEKMDFYTLEEAAKKFPKVSKSQVQKYIDDHCFPKGVVFYEDGVAYILKGVIEDYSWFMENQKWVYKAIQNRLQHLLSKGMNYADIGNGLVNNTTIRSIHKNKDVNPRITFRICARLTSKESNFGISQKALILEAKDLKEFGSKSKFIEKPKEEAKSIGTLGSLFDIPEIEEDVDKDVITKPELKKLESNRLDDADEIDDGGETDDPWDVLLALQNEISELKTRIDDLECENAFCKKELARLEDQKKDKRFVRRCQNDLSK